MSGVKSTLQSRQCAPASFLLSRIFYKSLNIIFRMDSGNAGVSMGHRGNDCDKGPERQQFASQKPFDE